LNNTPVSYLLAICVGTGGLGPNFLVLLLPPFYRHFKYDILTEHYIIISQLHANCKDSARLLFYMSQKQAERSMIVHALSGQYIKSEVSEKLKLTTRLDSDDRRGTWRTQPACFACG